MIKLLSRKLLPNKVLNISIDRSKQTVQRSDCSEGRYGCQSGPVRLHERANMAQHERANMRQRNHEPYQTEYPRYLLLYLVIHIITRLLFLFCANTERRIGINQPPYQSFREALLMDLTDYTATIVYQAYGQKKDHRKNVLYFLYCFTFFSKCFGPSLYL